MKVPFSNARCQFYQYIVYIYIYHLGILLMYFYSNFGILIPLISFYILISLFTI